MSLEIRGYLVKRGEVGEFGSNGFKKREIRIETEGQYPQIIQFELQQDKVDIANKFAKNELVNVKFNINGREWENEKQEVVCFTTLVAWRVEPVEIGRASIENRQQPASAEPIKKEVAKSQPQAVTAADAVEPIDENLAEEPDDLPF